MRKYKVNAFVDSKHIGYVDYRQFQVVARSKSEAAAKIRQRLPIYQIASVEAHRGAPA